MSTAYGFELIEAREVTELKTRGRLYRHTGTGAEFLCLLNQDENKVFGITFRTPPADSTGVPHILEHSVLCGSRKYPVKEPFVELLKGSLQTFLNAFTYPDKTCYPVASQNRQDFLNLLDVYLDAVFHPRLTPSIFQQEGWHYEMDTPAGPLRYKGVVFNEMKGAYGSPDNVLGTCTLQSLFPESPYGYDSGGDPAVIPNLTYEQFADFHRRYYHPSNARLYCYGDLAPEEIMPLLQTYLQDFDRQTIDSAVPLQTAFAAPKTTVRPFMVGAQEGSRSKGMVALSWVLGQTAAPEHNFALRVLEYILLGMPGSPLRRALIESRLGEDLAGEGLGAELRQLYFSVGLKGIDPERAGELENLVLGTLRRLAEQGLDPLTVEAALNTVEFRLRENNSGHYPRGLVLMLRSLTTWLYDGDPFSLLAFAAPLEKIKAAVKQAPHYFEDLLVRCFLHNPHRATLILKPDPEMQEAAERAEAERLAGFRRNLTPAQLDGILAASRALREEQTAPDPPAALAAIPVLRLEDLERHNRSIPAQQLDGAEISTLFHDIPTNGIVYLDVGLNLHALPAEYLPYVPLFSRALLEMGTRKEDFSSLSQRISAKTGGIRPERYTSVAFGREKAAAWLFLRGKALAHQVPALTAILQDILLSPALDNPERFRQMVMEEKARAEHGLVPAGHQAVAQRLRAHFSEAHRAAEIMGGVSYIHFLRHLVQTVAEDWPRVHAILEDIQRTLVNRRLTLFNLTIEESMLDVLRKPLDDLGGSLPDAPAEDTVWKWDPLNPAEGMIVPSQVNYVGKGGALYGMGYRFHGSAQVITRYLRNAWLWNQVRVQGGAYGAFCAFDRFSGVLTFVSYRDPNVAETLKAFDGSADFLRNTDLPDEERRKAIIGAIGELDSHLLPDARGFVSLLRRLCGDSDAARQKMREEILATEDRHFKDFGEILEAFRQSQVVKVLGAGAAIEKARSALPDGLQLVSVL